MIKSTGAQRLLGRILIRPAVATLGAAIGIVGLYQFLHAPSVGAFDPVKPKAAKADFNRGSYTPANVADRSRRNELVARLELDELGLRLIGTVTFNKKPSVCIQHPGQRDQMIYAAGDVIGGFKISDIQEQYVVFERDGIQLWRAIGASAGEDELVEPEDHAVEEIPYLSVQRKRTTADIKEKTKAYASSKIVDILPKEQFSRMTRTRSAQPAPAPVEVASASAAAPAPRSGGRYTIPASGRVTSRFGYRQAPIGGGRKYHRGVDIAAAYRSPITATSRGQVVKVSRSWAKGLNVLIQHEGGFSSAYFHMSKALVSEGDTVEQGETIGLVGSSGQATGPHLHFELHRNGVPVDPAAYMPDLSRR